MNTEFVRADGRFVPTSIPEFSERAKRLARLVDVPLQTAQEALARIYGFTGLHEGQQVIKAGEIEGPYEEDLLALWREPPGAGGLAEIASTARAARNRRLHAELDRVVTANGGVRGHISDAYDAGLFCRPPAHRVKFQRVMAKRAVRDGAQAGRPADVAAPSAYARYVESREGGGYFEYTPLGQSVADALSELREGYADHGGRYAVALNQLHAAHPLNPWVRTEWLQYNCVAWWLGGWADYSRSEKGQGYPTEEAEDGFLASAGFAGRWYEEARQTIALFESLLPARGAGVRKPYLGESLAGDDGSYLVALYWGGRTAVHHGRYAAAKRWLGRCIMADQRDGLGARYYHSVAALMGGSARPRGKRPDDLHDVWAWLQELAWDLKANEYERAARSLEQALSCSPHVIRAVHPRFNGANALRVNSNHDTLAHIQEFMFVTREFWGANAECKAWLDGMTLDRGVRTATIAFHQARSAARGAAYMEPEVAAQRLRSEHATREMLTATVEAAAFTRRRPS